MTDTLEAIQALCAMLYQQNQMGAAQWTHEVGLTLVLKPGRPSLPLPCNLAVMLSTICTERQALLYHSLIHKVCCLVCCNRPPSCLHLCFAHVQAAAAAEPVTATRPTLARWISCACSLLYGCPPANPVLGPRQWHLPHSLSAQKQMQYRTLPAAEAAQLAHLAALLQG